MINLLSSFILPICIFSILCIGFWKNVNVFEAFIEGAQEGINITIKILPYIIAIFAAVDLMNSSGLLKIIIGLLKPVTALINFPSEVLPLILIKPFSGSGYIVVLADIYKNYGTETFIGKFASILAGSTETIFYVLTVYFGAIGVKNIRYSLAAAVTTEIAAIIMAFLVAKIFF